MVTRDDVAKAAGTSVAVVSYVVNNGPRPVAPATRQRVLEAVAELGYRPNTLARSLRSSRSKTLGVVIDDWDTVTIDLLRGAERAASDHDVRLFVGRGATEGEANRHVRAFVDRRADGVLLFTRRVPEPAVAELARSGTAGVSVWSLLPPGSGVSLAAPDDLHGHAVSHLGQHGSTRFVFVSETTTNATTRGAYAQIVTLHEFLRDPVDVPSGLVCQGVTVALAVHSRVGDDPRFPILAIGDTDRAAAGAIATLTYPWRECGELATQWLLDRTTEENPMTPGAPTPTVTCDTSHHVAEMAGSDAHVD